MNRALVPDRRVERMVVGDKPKGKWNIRLAGAVEMARQAVWEDLDLGNLCGQVLERRRKHTKDFNMQVCESLRTLGSLQSLSNKPVICLFNHCLFAQSSNF